MCHSAVLAASASAPPLGRDLDGCTRAYIGARNDKGQYLYYGKSAGCIITGNEDGAKACAMDLLYAMSHIGYFQSHKSL